MGHFEVGHRREFVAVDDEGKSLTIVVEPVFRTETLMRSGHKKVENSVKELSDENGEPVTCVEGVEGQFYRCSDPGHIFKSDDELAIKLTEGKKQCCRRC